MPNRSVPAQTYDSATSAPRGGLSRRELLTATGALGLGLGALLAGCGGSEKKPAASGTADGGPWSFKDDRGKVVRTDKTPKNLVAFISTAAALHDYGIECTGVFGPSKPVNGKPNPQAGNLDVAKLTSLGEAWGEFNVEKYAALQPDLLISNMFPPPALWFVPEESSKKIAALAPTVGIAGAHRSLREALERVTDLAAALGADLKAQQVTAARRASTRPRRPCGRPRRPSAASRSSPGRVMPSRCTSPCPTPNATATTSRISASSSSRARRATSGASGSSSAGRTPAGTTPNSS